MTDYNKWNKYNIEEDSKRIENEWHIEKVSNDIIEQEKKQLNSLEEIINKIKNISIALHSKAAVEVLKSKSGRNRRRKEQEITNSSSSTTTTTTNNNNNSSNLPIINLATSMENFATLIEEVIKENIQTVKNINSQKIYLAYDSGYSILLKIPNLEDAFNSVLTSMESVGGITLNSNNTFQINPEEIEGQTLLAISEARERVHSIMAHTTATLAICSFSIGDYAAAADFCRCHIKIYGKSSNDNSNNSTPSFNPNSQDLNFLTNIQQKNKDKLKSSNSSIVAMWIIRGRTMIALGSPYLARLHFNQVKSLSPQFPQIETILEMLNDAQLLAAKHSSTIGLLTIQDLIEYDIRRLFHISTTATATSFSLNKIKSSNYRQKMLSSQVILDDISKYLITPLIISLSLHSPMCTPCSTNITQYENKIQSRSHYCHSPACSTDFYSSNDNSLHMSDIQNFNLQNNSTSSSNSQIQNSSQKNYRSKFKLTRNLFPQNIFNIITSQIKSLSSQPLHYLTSLVSLTNPITQQNTIESSSHNIIYLYLIYIRRSFYSAQILYLEGLHRSSELQYWTCVILILSCYYHSTLIQQNLTNIQIPFTLSTTKSITKSTCQSVEEYLKLYYSVSLINIASCQIYQPNYKPLSPHLQNSLFIASNALQDSHLPNGFHSIGTLLTSTPLQLCDYSINLLSNDPIPLIRKGIILSYLKRYDKAIETFQLASEMLLYFTDSIMNLITTQSNSTNHKINSNFDENNNNENNNSNNNNTTNNQIHKSPIVSHFIMDYGDRSIFSQSFIARIDSQLPFMNNQNDILMIIQVLYSYITKEIERSNRLKSKNIL